MTKKQLLERLATGGAPDDAKLYFHDPETDDLIPIGRVEEKYAEGSDHHYPVVFYGADDPAEVPVGKDERDA